MQLMNITNSITTNVTNNNYTNTNNHVNICYYISTSTSTSIRSAASLRWATWSSGLPSLRKSSFAVYDNNNTNTHNDNNNNNNNNNINIHHNTTTTTTTTREAADRLCIRILFASPPHGFRVSFAVSPKQPFC